MRYIRIDSDTPSELNTVESAKYIVDNLLPNDDAKTFYFVSFAKYTSYLMIAQKLNYQNGYASFILFGYSSDNIIYRAKSDGVWTS